jgi:15-cis-phytoene desaturase
MPHVVVIGGGIGGLSAAHELVDRGFTVDVYEARPDFGGKARSQAHGAAPPGKRPLPGEHGFRFYPRFYKHIIDTMAKIPDGAGFVVDHLQPTSEAALALIDNSTWYKFNRKQVGTPYNLIETLELFFQELDFDAEDISVYVAKLLEYATSCDERREGEYEHMSWWEFLDATSYSEGFAKSQRGIPRMMVAMDPVVGSARTIGTISMQLFADFGATGGHTDRTMGGPTTQMWIDPWVAHLASKGVNLHLNETCTGLDVAGGKISQVTFSGAGAVTADYYVLAVPLEVAMQLITPAMGALDPALETLRLEDVDKLASWMVGIQYFLYEDVPMVRGHLFFPDSPWALTAISQPQFWRKLGLFRKTYGDGSVGGCISVDISDWNTPGKLIPKTAKMCTPDEIAEEVWYQIKSAVNGTGDGGTVLTDDLRHSYHLDTDLDYSGGLPPINTSRLLVHPPGSWQVRPEAGTRIPNLVLASDYVKTHTNLATMEGANEAARRAVNAIIERSGSTAGKSEIWPLVETGRIFVAMKALDRLLYRAGRKHLFQIAGIKQGARAAWWIRKISKYSGLDGLDNHLDKVFRPTKIIRSILGRFGITLP